MGMVGRLKLFFQESRREFTRVNWPSREQAIRHTLLVVGISLGIAAFLGALDFLFAAILDKIIAS